jgi:CRISPR-associated protein Cas2
MRSRYLVCYDIADPARLGRVYRYLKDEALHLQYSVFLGSFTWPKLQEVKAHLERLIDRGADDVRIYPLPAAEAILALGLEDRVPEGAEVYLP